MKNELFSIGPFTVYGYGFMIALGVLLAYGLSCIRSRRWGLDQDFLSGFIFWSVGGGFLGAKLMFWIVSLPEILADPGYFVETLSDGFVVIGGIILGVICAYAYCRRKKQDFFFWLDYILPFVAVGQGFGRLGCFMAGCCYGRETEGPFYVEFHSSRYAPNFVHLYPTQLLGAGLNFLNALICLSLGRRLGRGQVAGVYFLNYSVGRFLLEFLRGDEQRGFVGILSTSQFISLFTLAFGIYLIVRGGKGEKEKRKGAE